MRHIQISEYRQHPAVRELLALAADPVDEAALQELLDDCERLQVLAVFGKDGTPAALAAYRLHDEYSLCVEYSAADPRWPGARRYLCTLPHAPLLARQPDTDPAYEQVDGRPSRGIIDLAPADGRWPDDFEKIRAALAAALGARALAIEHTGSTSVPGLPAKPLIDIALLVPDADDEERYVPQLRAAGMVFWHREPGWYKHRMFKPGAGTGLANGNIHVFSAGSPEFLRMVLFRDHLRSHPADRDAYAEVKREAAQQLAALRGAQGLVMDYNRIKEPFILDLHRRIFSR